MKTLEPSIDEIRRNLFAPSYDLVNAWVEHPETLDATLIKKLEASKLAQIEKQEYLQNKESIETTEAEILASDFFSNETTKEVAADPTEKQSDVPDLIKKIIQQRYEISTHQFSSIPSEGLIIRVTKGNGSVDDLDLEMASPLTVILDTPTKNKQVWTGWIIASEIDYASTQDFLLDEDLDAPLNPFIKMVQAWNPVQFYLPLAEKTIGELQPQRLQALRKFAKKLNTSESTSKHSDAIQQYQSLYSQVTDLLEDKLVIAENPFAHWKSLFLAQSKKMGQIFTPVPIVNYAMGEGNNDTEEKNWLFDKHYLFHFKQQIVEGKLLIEISIKHTKPDQHCFILEYKESGQLAHYAELSREQSSTEFICDPANCDANNPTELIIKNSDGIELHRLNLSPE